MIFDKNLPIVESSPVRKDILPNFLIVGAAKSGTTSIHSYLNQHPEIYMSPLKETEFFINISNKLVVEGPNTEIALSKGVHSFDEYHKLFEDVKNEIAIGETTPGYLYHPWVAGTIHEYIPDCKIIVILRNPVDRAFSHFKMLQRMGIESDISFIEAIRLEEKRVSENWGIGFHYTRRGFYYTQLKRYFDIFDKDQIQVFLFDDLKNKESQLFINLFDFLGVDNSFVPNTSIKLNTSDEKKMGLDGSPGRKSAKQVVRQVLEKINLVEKKTKNLEKNLAKNNSLTKDEREYVLPIFKQEISLLENLIHKDLSFWLKQ
jgi:hypothetical protein